LAGCSCEGCPSRWRSCFRGHSGHLCLGNTVGCLVPIVAHAIGIDPGDVNPLINPVVDATGLLIYLTVGDGIERDLRRGIRGLAGRGGCSPA
jgi:hypothetical protein